MELNETKQNLWSRKKEKEGQKEDGAARDELAQPAERHLTEPT